jgi:hypothetical protein
MSVDPNHSRLLFGTRPRALADGTTPIVVKVRLRDSRDRPVTGRQVELMADRAGVTIAQPDPTDANGLALGYVRATTPGPVNITGVVLPADA